jgi:hypothetical protein
MQKGYRHEEFACVFRPDFEVVEERQGNVRRYPHTAQLPLLQRALDLEFKNALPGHIARTDKRGDGFHKDLLKHAGLHFCSFFNAARADGLLLKSLPDPDLVTRVTVVQHITEETRRGPQHRFKFYGGADFFTEIRLAGRRLVFTDHVLQRFCERVPNNVGENLSFLLMAFFGAPIIAMPVGPGLAFMVTYHDSILAFPFELENNELVITTCLTVKEMNSMERQMPPLVFNPHYGESFTAPRLRHWLPTKWMLDIYERWERKVPLPPPWKEKPKRMTWHWMAQRVKDGEVKKGHGPGTTLFFLDHVPGPCMAEFLPGQPEPQVDELKIYHEINPQVDWDDAFAKRDWYIQHFEMPKDPPA